MNPIAEDILMHYGMPRRSGRYPWGSGDNPYQHSGDFLSRVQELKKSGMSETEIAKNMGLTTTQLRTQMSLANVTTGGYVGSAMYTTNLANAKTIVNNAFGSAVLTHREYMCNAVTNGKPSGGAWFDSNVELPNECMMYGHLHFSPTSDGSTMPSIYTISKTQLALFMVKPTAITIGSTYWLRDVVSSAGFAAVSHDGDADYHDASTSHGVRPVFPIG